MSGSFAHSLVESAHGAALLGTLELLASTDTMPDAGSVCPLPASTPAGLERGAELAAALPLGRLIQLATTATDSISAWYDLRRPVPIYKLARQRLPIAEAVAARPDLSEMSQPGSTTQWFWNDRGWLDRKVGTELEQNDPSNWFPSRSTLATCSPFPDAASWSTFEAPVHDVWDLCFGPVSRWSVTTDPAARIYELNEPADWLGLVRRFPHVVPMTAEIQADLMTGGFPDIARCERFTSLDWTTAAAHYDGLHLTWAGYLTTDAQPLLVGDGTATLLRRWGAERTAWLAVPLNDPQPLPIDPAILENVLEHSDSRWDLERQQWDRLLK